MNVLVIHHSKFGNGEKIAKAIADGLREQGHQVEVVNVTDLSLASLEKYNTLLIGSPTHVGGLTRKVGGALKKIGAKYSGKPFIGYATNMNPKATTLKKLESKAQASGLRKVMDGKMFRVKSVKGPLEDGAIDEAKSFGKAVGEKLK